MKKLLLCSALTGLLSVIAPAVQAADNVVLIELFTSQGCSSCPPADRNLARLAERDDVLPLSLHVDYWDYLGWRDTFGRAEHTQRQYEYRRLMGARVVYTPQMIVQGTLDVPGYRPDMTDEAIARVQAAPVEAEIRIDRSDGMYVAKIETTTKRPDCTIWMVGYDRKSTVDIDRGENAGKTITYHNVADKLQRVGPCNVRAGRSVNLPTPEPGRGVAVWLQDDGTGEIIAASFVEG